MMGFKWRRASRVIAPNNPRLWPEMRGRRNFRVMAAGYHRDLCAKYLVAIRLPIGTFEKTPARDDARSSEQDPAILVEKNASF
ncbi:hypothetical protein [Bradyrhizobium sp. WSM2793]|uniref:hypothetical protein n=1 Tax=Bradyrhizobium sp. WSM2793 TaxID=1038866 RepID=UPI00036F1C8C|nr:hypothetical protein [Bradyrhizobium sp. WSM2793]